MPNFSSTWKDLNLVSLGTYNERACSFFFPTFIPTLTLKSLSFLCVCPKKCNPPKKKGALSSVRLRSILQLSHQPPYHIRAHAYVSPVCTRNTGNSRNICGRDAVVLFRVGKYGARKSFCCIPLHLRVGRKIKNVNQKERKGDHECLSRGTTRANMQVHARYTHAGFSHF